MIISVVRAFFLLSLIAFLGTHARTLPEDVFKMSIVYHGQTSIFGRPSAPSEHHPSPQYDPPHHYGNRISGGTGHLRNMITRPAKAPPPPPLSDVGSELHTSAYEEWTKHGHTPPSHPSPQVAPGHEQGQLTSISNHVTAGSPYEEIIKHPRELSPPPTPRVAPPHIQTSSYCATGSSCIF